MTDVIAHRGASRQAPQNTIQAFELAVRLGADGIELDVRRTADDVLVVHHDAHLPDGRAIVEVAWHELPPAVPTLGAALDACAGAWVNIEIKNDEREPDFDPDDHVAVAVLADLAERAPGRWLISSFRERTVDRCRLLDPSVPTAYLTFEITPAIVDRTVQHGHTAVNPWEAAITAAAVATCHDAGILVNAWTCNGPDRCPALAAAGVDGVVTDVPDVMRAALAAR